MFKKSKKLSIILCFIILLSFVPNFRTSASFPVQGTLKTNGSLTNLIKLTSKPLYYRFTLSSTGEVELSALQYGKEFRALIVDAYDVPIWNCINKDGNYNSDYPFGYTYGSENNPARNSTTIILKKGTYYLKLLYGMGDYANDPEDINVRVAIKVTSFGINPSYTDSEFNAIPVTVPVKKSGYLILNNSSCNEPVWEEQNLNEEDWYKIKIPLIGFYEIYLDFDEDNDYASVDIYDSKHQEYEYNYNELAYQANVFKKGYYYIRVTGRGKYTLYMKRRSMKVDETFMYKNLQYIVTKSTPQGGTVAFYGSKKSLSTINIPDEVVFYGYRFKVTEIWGTKIYDRKCIKKVVIGNNAKTITGGAFWSCENMTDLTIGKGLTRIDHNAFRFCYKLKKINIKSTKIKTIKNYAFDNISENAKITVPKKCYTKYRKLIYKAGAPSGVKIIKK